MLHMRTGVIRGDAELAYNIWQTALCLTSVPFSRVRPAKKSPKRCSAAPSPASRSRGASASSSAWLMRAKCSASQVGSVVVEGYSC